MPPSLADLSDRASALITQLTGSAAGYKLVLGVASTIGVGAVAFACTRGGLKPVADRPEPEPDKGDRAEKWPRHEKKLATVLMPTPMSDPRVWVLGALGAFVVAIIIQSGNICSMLWMPYYPLHYLIYEPLRAWCRAVVPAADFLRARQFLWPYWLCPTFIGLVLAAPMSVVLLPGAAVVLLTLPLVQYPMTLVPTLRGSMLRAPAGLLLLYGRIKLLEFITELAVVLVANNIPAIRSLLRRDLVCSLISLYHTHTRTLSLTQTELFLSSFFSTVCSFSSGRFVATHWSIAGSIIGVPAGDLLHDGGRARQLGRPGQPVRLTNLAAPSAGCALGRPSHRAEGAARQPCPPDRQGRLRQPAGQPRVPAGRCA